MKKILILLLIVGIPIVGAFSSKHIENKMNQLIRIQLHDFLQEEAKNKNIDDNQKIESYLSNLNLDKICNSTELVSSFNEICGGYEAIRLVTLASYISGLVGFILILSILVAGYLAKLNRYILLFLFKPGVFITFFVTIGLILTNTAILLIILYYFPVVYLERFFPKLLLVIGIGALYGIYLMIRSMILMLQRSKTLVIGKNVTEQDQPKLWEYIRELSDKMGAKPPQNIVLGIEPNFYVTEAHVNCIGDKKLTGRTMYLSMPLVRIFSEKELRAVIGHELGHYVGLDTKFSNSFYPIYRSTSDALLRMHSLNSNQTSNGFMIVAMLPAMGILSIFLNAFSIAESKISRERELNADNIGCEISNTHAMATALIKVHAFSGYWSLIQDKNAERINAGEYISNQSLFFQSLVTNTCNAESLEGLENTRTHHPTDSHPPLITRLKNLNLTLDALKSEVLDVSPNDACLNLFMDIEKIETDISLIHSLLLAKELGISFDSIPDKNH